MCSCPPRFLFSCKIGLVQVSERALTVPDIMRIVVVPPCLITWSQSWRCAFFASQRWRTLRSRVPARFALMAHHHQQQ